MSMFNPTQVVTRGTGMLSDLATLAAFGVAIAAGVQIYYLARYKVDFLLGTFGIQTMAEDRFELAGFWLLLGLFALSIGTGRYVKVAAGVLLVYLLYTLNGTAYQITGTPTLSPETMPKVSDGATIPAYDHPDSVLKAAPAATTRLTAAEMAQFATDKGYTIDKKLTGDINHPNTPLGWCVAINPKTTKPNANNSEHSLINCTTGYRYAPPANGS